MRKNIEEVLLEYLNKPITIRLVDEIKSRIIRVIQQDLWVLNIQDAPKFSISIKAELGIIFIIPRDLFSAIYFTGLEPDMPPRSYVLSDKWHSPFTDNVYEYRDGQFWWSKNKTMNNITLKFPSNEMGNS